MKKHQKITLFLHFTVETDLNKRNIQVAVKSDRDIFVIVSARLRSSVFLAFRKLNLRLLKMS